MYLRTCVSTSHSERGLLCAELLIIAAAHTSVLRLLNVFLVWNEELLHLKVDSWLKIGYKIIFRNIYWHFKEKKRDKTISGRGCASWGWTSCFWNRVWNWAVSFEALSSLVTPFPLPPLAHFVLPNLFSNHCPSCFFISSLIPCTLWLLLGLSDSTPPSVSHIRWPPCCYFVGIRLSSGRILLIAIK